MNFPTLILPVGIILGAVLPLASRALGGCIEAVPDNKVYDESSSVAEWQVIASEAIQADDETIHTRLTLRLVESFKGDAPATIQITSPGGTVGRRADFRSDSLLLKRGKSYVLMMSRDGDGNWIPQPHHAYRASANPGQVRRYFRGHMRGPRPELTPATASESESDQSPSGIPGSVVTTTGYIESSGQPTRFTVCDGNNEIPYLIDIDPTKLPTGMDQAGAIAAVGEALNSWAAVSSLKFRYEGTQSFGAAASSISIEDRRLRIQLHDNFNAIINSSGALGIGGGSSKSPSATFTGGKVGSQGFQERLFGYVVLESTTNASFMLNTANFKRVLTHEIGHSLGLAHSSESPSEPDVILKAATMYYNASPGSAGATIQAYDVDRILFGYPVTNTPPFTIDRLIPAITTDPSFGTLPAVPGVNRIILRAIDKQGTALTASITSSTSASGTFALSGNVLSYTPDDYWEDGQLTDALTEEGYYFDQALVQFSDGVNLSGTATCVVTGFFGDSTPSDGLPDDWMTDNFSTKTPGALGSGRNPDDDPDKDGLTNRVEFYLNTNPNLANSGPVTPVYAHADRRISFTPVRFAPYWIESSESLAAGSWALRGMGTRYQASGTLTSKFGGSTPPREFYRVVTGP